MKHLVFLGLSALGIALIVTNSILANDLFWDFIDYTVISIFVANAIVYGRTRSRLGAAFAGICSVGAALYIVGVIIDFLPYWATANVIVVCLFVASIGANAYLYRRKGIMGDTD